MSNKSRKKGSSRSRQSASSGPTQVQAGSGSQTKSAYEPSQLEQEPSGALPIIMLIGGFLGLVALAFLGISWFAPGLLPPFLQSGATSTPAAALSGGRISFVRTTSESTTRDLYVVNYDGSNQQQITNNVIVGGTTQWSPDGKRILLQGTVEGTETIVVITVSSDNKQTEALQLTADVKADSAFPAWSPDGSKIAFQSKREGNNPQVFVMDADGNNKHRLSSGSGFAGQPTWSPDGKNIAFIAGDSAEAGIPAEIYIVPVEGGTPRAVTALGQVLRRPQWAADGKSIVCVEGGDAQNTAIIAANTDGSPVRTLVPAGPNSGPVVSPSGEMVAYYSVTQALGSNILTVPLAGGTPTPITTTGTEDYQAVWSPDGKQLAWAQKSGSADFKIVVANADGSERRTVSSGDGVDYQPAWGVLPR